MEAEAGLTVMDLSTGAEAAVTVSTAGLLVTLPNVAVTLVLPAATPLARPAEIVASAGIEEFQVTLEVRF
jgi:cyanate permease